MIQHTTEESRQFWSGIVTNPDGSLNEEQVWKELHDFHFLLSNVPLVYDHVTGGRASKIMTDPDVINSLADEFYGDIHRS